MQRILPTQLAAENVTDCRSLLKINDLARRYIAEVTVEGVK